jgi:hypothetical protein
MSLPQAVANKLQERFTGPVLAAVAELSTEVVLSDEGEPNPAFIRRIVDEADLTIGKVTYSFNAECRPVVHFHLTGDTAFFQEHFGSLLKGNWSCEPGRASVLLPLEVQEETAIKGELPVLKSELDRAVRAFHGQWRAMQVALHKVAQDAYWRRVHFERAMQDLKIPKDPKVQEEVPEPPGFGIG